MPMTPNHARRPLVALAAALVTALAVCLAPASALAAGSGEYTYENGTLGFFKWLGADEAVEVIEESPDHDIVGPFQDLSNMASRDSAFNLDNMYRALDNIERCNELRALHGAPASLVDPYLMAISEVNTNFSSANYLTHSNAYAGVSENIAWGFQDPFSRWYYDEKAEWESDELTAPRELMESLLAKGYTYEQARGQAVSAYPDLTYGGGGRYGVLHYLNLIHPLWYYTGAASTSPISWPGFEAYGCDEQTFYYTTPSDKTYTVDEFRAKLDEYLSYVTGEHPFFDVHEGDWYYGAVTWVAEKGIMSGYSGEGEGSFGPVDKMQRSQAAQMLYNIAGSPSADSSALGAYNDVSGGEWYADAVAWATQAGVMNGYGGAFSPNAYITREQIVTVLWRMEGSPRGTADLSESPDGNEVSQFAREAMEWAVGLGIVNGDANTGELNPTDFLDRAQAATIIMNWYEVTGR